MRRKSGTDSLQSNHANSHTTAPVDDAAQVGRVHGEKVAGSPTRFFALDVLRGMTIALMILVNTPGSWEYIFAPFEHADWHGYTPTDMVFPFFVCIVGAAMYFAFAKFDFQLNPALSVKILRRTALIFLIGLALNVFPFTAYFADWRFLGVLQRIALVYMLASFIVLLLPFAGRVCAMLVLLLGYWAVLNAWGGPSPYALEENAVRAWDLALFGASHLWQGKGIAFDPEGLLSTLPAVVNALIGFEAARWLVSQPMDRRVPLKLLAVGALAIVVGHLWATVFPINKSLWTSTFVLVTCGYFLVCLALILAVVDVLGKTRWANIWVVYGSNPLFIYALAAIWATTYYLIPIAGEAGNLYNALFLLLQAWLPNKVASLVFALTHVVLFWWISYFLYRKRIFIKV